MAARSLALLAALPILLAGCVSLTPASLPTTGTPLDGLLSSEEPLWVDPQNAPHPAFNFPTLTNPPVGVDVPAFWQPIEVRALPGKIAGLEHVSATKDQVKRGGGIALFGRLAVVPGYGEPSKILDITDPEDPSVLAEMASEGGFHRGAVVIPYPDGRLVTAISTEYGFDVWEITEPAEPAHLGQVEAPTGGHKIGVVPGTPIVYNANSWGGGDSLLTPTGHTPATATGQTEIYDLSDPANPVLVQEFKNGYGCHHIYFWIHADAEKYRAICAGIEMTQIWDIADPLNPEVIVNVPVHHGNPNLPSTSVPIVFFSHFAILNDEGTVLIVGDETGGGGLPPGCDARVDTPAKQVSGPLGNLYFYDVSDETNPQLKGSFSASTVLPRTVSCTAHHGRIVPAPDGSDLLAIAFYGAGVVLVDFTDPMDPRAVDAWTDGSDTWEVWYYNGYLFTGDLARGLDVLTFK